MDIMHTMDSEDVSNPWADYSPGYAIGSTIIVIAAECLARAAM